MKTHIILLMLVTLAACSDSTPKIDDPGYSLSEIGLKPVASVDSQKITRAQLDHALAFYSSNPMAGAKDGRLKVLNDMIEEQVMYNQAVKHGFNNSPEFLNNQRKLLAYEYRKFLKSKADLNTKITDIDLEIYYEKNIKKYTKPAMSRLAIYQLRDDIPNKSELSLSEVRTAVEALKIQEGFGKYALTSHHSNTANKAGKLPWVGNGSRLSGIPLMVLEEGAGLDLGDVSESIKTDKGIFLVRLMAIKDKIVTPLDQIKSSLRQQLVIEQKQKALNGFLAKAKESSNIEIYENNLNVSASLNTQNDSMGPPGFPVK